MPSYRDDDRIIMKLVMFSFVLVAQLCAVPSLPTATGPLLNEPR